MKHLLQSLAILAASSAVLVLIQALQRSLQLQEQAELLPHPEAVAAGTTDDDIACVPPPPPAPAPLSLPAELHTPPVLGREGRSEKDAQRFWLFLQQETYRQRGEGFRSDWAFHQYAASNNLGAPLARSAPRGQWVRYGGKAYGFQPFARDTIYNEIPRWAAVESLHSIIGAAIPDSGLARQLLDASFLASGAPLRGAQAFARLVVRERLGPALTDGFTIAVEGQRWDMQVFALETLASPSGRPTEIQRLSTLPPGSLRERLWEETCKQAGAVYQPASPFQQLAAREKLGSPLTGIYRVSFEGNPFEVQVFALDTLYARPGEPPARQSSLPLPPLAGGARPLTPEHTSAADALSDRRPLFALLPLAGQPPISQLYGYTRFAAGAGRRFYGATQGRHSGIDFAVPTGTPLLAIDYGVVVWAGPNSNGISFGAGPRSIIVRYGSIYALYGHTLSESVRRGQAVCPGQEIGRSGYPSAPHLHFELRPVPASMLNNHDPEQRPVNPGFAVNPLDYFSADLMGYFRKQLASLGGTEHFCCGSLDTQDQITFGAPVDDRPCT